VKALSPPATLAWLVAAASLALLGAPGARADTALQAVRDLQGRFTIDVPAGWTVKVSRGDPALEVLGPPPEGALPASLDIIVRDLPIAISPETCIVEAGLVMRRGIPFYTTVARGPMRIGALVGYTHAYVWQSKTGEERRSLQVCVAVGRRTVVVIATTGNLPARVRDDMPVLLRAIQTLRLVPPQQQPDRPGGDHGMSRGAPRRGSSQ
jgi:hypothetical protein